MAGLDQNTTAPAIWLDEIDSTNAEAGRRLAHGQLVNGWLMARRQTAGKGRQSRPWSSPEGNFMGTYCWPIGERIDLVQGLSLAVGLAVRTAVMQFYRGPEDVSCKWPNDVLIGRAKTCGILIETQKADDGQYWGLLGIGVNLINTSSPDGRATGFVSQGLSSAPTPQAFLDVLAPLVETCISSWPPQDRAAFQAQWARHAYGLGERVVVSTMGPGQFDGIEATGEARVRLDTGQIVSVQAGDLSFPSLSGEA